MAPAYNYQLARPIIARFFTDQSIGNVAVLTPTYLNDLYDQLSWERGATVERRHKGNLLKWIRRNMPEFDVAPGDRFAATSLINRSMAERQSGLDVPCLVVSSDSSRSLKLAMEERTASFNGRSTSSTAERTASFNGSSRSTSPSSFEIDIEERTASCNAPSTSASCLNLDKDVQMADCYKSIKTFGDRDRVCIKIEEEDRAEQVVKIAVGRSDLRKRATPRNTGKMTSVVAQPKERPLSAMKKLHPSASEKIVPKKGKQIELHTFTTLISNDETKSSDITDINAQLPCEQVATTTIPYPSPPMVSSDTYTADYISRLFEPYNVNNNQMSQMSQMSQENLLRSNAHYHANVAAVPALPPSSPTPPTTETLRYIFLAAEKFLHDGAVVDCLLEICRATALVYPLLRKDVTP
ncbi:unnamed protein product [Zymoseptoria tritici ST99CH_1A5]|uniref:Uncharacterized protein n=1 Tax=Zymoseptoria tritici ST99CH_1A5 TaxID=1276529 RepID=A0A1Y6M1D7_ZYMTR|nr:unnamed protein product [Zymoseptoria tritici ST99CH_1A5]